MSEGNVKTRPLWRWLFWRTWCVVGLPWLLAAVVLTGVGLVREGDAARRLLSPGYEAALRSVQRERAALEQLAQNAGANMRVEELTPHPGVLAVAAWQTAQQACWLYHNADHDHWYRVVEEPGPPAVHTLHALSEGVPSTTPTIVPGEWRAQGAALGAAMSRLRKHKDENGRAFTWQYEAKLALSSAPGFLLLVLQELEGGNIRGSYLEVEAASLLPTGTTNSEQMPVFLARQNAEGILSWLVGTLPEGIHIDQRRVRDWEPQRLESGKASAWLAGEGTALSGEDRLFVGAMAADAQVLWEALWPAAVCGGVALLATLILLVGQPFLYQRFTRELGSAVNEIRRLDVLRGPYYWPKTRIAELRQIFSAVEEAASALGNREDQVRLAPETIEATARPTLLVEAIPDAPSPEPSSQYPATPPAAYIQAMESLRRQLGETRRELDTAREHRANASPDPVAEAALAERLRAALFAFDAPDRAAETLATALGTTDSASYRVNETFSVFSPEGDAPSTLPGEVVRTEHPLFFLAIARARSLWIDDVAADPRTASLFLGKSQTPPLSLSAVLLEDDTRLWLGLRPRGDLAWRAAEQLFAEAIAQRTAHQEAPALPPLAESIVVPPESAHALWAQPNLPNNPDAPMYRAITDNTAVGLFTLAKDGRINYVNASAERIFMRPAGDLLGQPFATLAMSEEAEAVWASLAQVQGGSPMDERDMYFQTGNNTKALLRVYFTPLQDESGEPTGFAGTVLDVTALRARELLLARQESVYRGIVEGAPQLLWSVDAIGCITFVNQVCMEFYGYRPDELIGRTLTTLCDESQARQDVERLALLLSGRTCAGYRTVHRHRDGTSLPLVVVAARQLDPSGRVTGAVGLAIAMGSNEDA